MFARNRKSHPVKGGFIKAILTGRWQAVCYGCSCGQKYHMDNRNASLLGVSVSLLLAGVGTVFGIGSHRCELLATASALSVCSAPIPKFFLQSVPLFAYAGIPMAVFLSRHHRKENAEARRTHKPPDSGISFHIPFFQQFLLVDFPFDVVHFLSLSWLIAIEKAARNGRLCKSGSSYQLTVWMKWKQFANLREIPTNRDLLI